MDRIKDIGKFIVWSYNKTDLEVKLTMLSFILIILGVFMDNDLTHTLFLCGMVISGAVMFKMLVIDSVKRCWESYQESK